MSKKFKKPKNKYNQPNTEPKNEQPNPSNEQKPIVEAPTDDEYMSDNTTKIDTDVESSSDYEDIDTSSSKHNTTDSDTPDQQTSNDSTPTSETNNIP